MTVEDTLQQLSQRLEKIEEQLHEQSNFRSNAGQQNPANNKKPNTKGQFKSFAADFMRTGKDPQSVVQQLLQNGRMTDDQFKQLGQMASQILKIGRF